MSTEMDKIPPKRIAINHDDYEAKHVGRAKDGRQFFLTTPFVGSMDPNGGREFLALYLFHLDGSLSEAIIEDLGTRANLDQKTARERIAQVLESLAPIRHGRIRVAPFKIERFGVEFGLIPMPPITLDDTWRVIAQPGNCMAFYPPWDGEYDT